MTTTFVVVRVRVPRLPMEILFVDKVVVVLRSGGEVLLGFVQGDKQQGGIEFLQKEYTRCCPPHSYIGRLAPSKGKYLFASITAIQLQSGNYIICYGRCLYIQT